MASMIRRCSVVLLYNINKPYEVLFRVLPETVTPGEIILCIFFLCRVRLLRCCREVSGAEKFRLDV